MKSYSPLFETIYDEQEPSSELGRGTHHSILRAIVGHDEYGDELDEIMNLDFAVIWDEDHDTRIISVLEKLHVSGQLSVGKIFGERKGNIYFIFNDVENEEYLDSSDIYTEITNTIKSDDVENWIVHIGFLSQYDPTIGIINDDKKKVLSYLEDISEKWNLGLKDIV